MEELPSGHGYADLVYIPMPNVHMPILLIELKVDTIAEGAISQIHEKKYHKLFENVHGEIVLCGISYDSKTKRHKCKIEKVTIGDSSTTVD